MHSTITQKSLTWFLAFVLCLSSLGIVCIQTTPAFAITENTEAELTQTQKRIEDSAAAYDEAAAVMLSLEEEIGENEAKISKLKETLPEQQEKSNEATVILYKLQEDGFNLLNMVLNAGSLDEFLSTLEYITRIQDNNMQEIARLNEMKAELEESQKSLSERKKQAEEEARTADAALKEAQDLREAAQRKAEEEAAAEAEAAAAAIAAAEAQAATEAGSQASPEAPPSSETPAVSAPGQVDWGTDKTNFVNEWGARIDAYLAGSPTAGYGRVYAEAAWNYGVDPRYSPAISNTESTKGQYCFKPYNAWGWMTSTNWGSWEEAIDAHVRGLSRGYSYTICIADAKKYCANWEHWYNSTLNQMNMI
ncbi:MAG: coiled-coil domain-containing protein [Raoultibacter sp.]